jgi:ABC-type methionine transport system ATPase subunit
MQNDAIFEVDQVSVEYGGERGYSAAAILHDVSFSLERGRTLSLVGPSQSGKSTLLRCLNRLVEPTSGVVMFDGQDIRSFDPRELRHRIALATQSPVLFEGTVAGSLRIRPAGMPGDYSRPRLRTVLAEVGLERDLLDRNAATLSSCEKQRVAIARALLRDPDVLLLDEPTSTLDPPDALLIGETISQLQTARGLSIVTVTTQPDLVRLLRGDLLYLVKGRVQALESVNGSDPHPVGDPRLQAFLAGEPTSHPDTRQ